ncbi:hypothetical protein CP533_3883 [Ophiocordyceps camponoti-saundersi (nom. inval.)]|nr:hypothetical protein CP533_3883 [Ophiocordyceps camponoti-saundersi (nom. inval.)]
MSGITARRRMLRLKDASTRLMIQQQRTFFSTSQWLSTESDEKPSIRQKSQAAVEEMTSLLKPQEEQQTQVLPAETAGIYSRSKVLDVKILPKGRIRSLDGLRGRGRAQVSVTPGSQARARRGWRKKNLMEDEGEDEEVEEDKIGSDGLTVEERVLDTQLRFGESTVYNPSFSKSDLDLFMPSEPSSAAGRRATVLENLCTLAGGTSVGVDENLGKHNHARRMKTDGIRYFVDLKDRDAIVPNIVRWRKNQKRNQGGKIIKAALENQQGQQQEAVATTGKETVAAEKGVAAAVSHAPVMWSAEESIRKTITDRAILGKYERPAFATDPVGIARAWHLRAGTYSSKDVESFERKLLSILAPKTNDPEKQPGAS